MTTTLAETFNAIILAGDRGPRDPLIKEAGVSCKALVPVSGRPMVLRVLDALGSASCVGKRFVCGDSSRLRGQNPELDALIAGGNVHWLENQASPSLSAQAALQALPSDQPVLLTTADHALLTPQMVDFFCTQAVETGRDVVAGVARADAVAAAFPEGRRTVTRLRDVAYCGCNLFAFLTPDASHAVTFWRRVEEQRKHPLKIVKSLGFLAVLRYLLGRLTLEEGLERMSALMHAHAGVVWMLTPEAAVDVDKLDDWTLAESILVRQREARAETAFH